MRAGYQGAKTRTYAKLYGFRNLIVWQRADDLALQVHEITAGWGPGHYRLASQMRSAAVSVKANIAEGYCRGSLGDYIRFCEIARGSLGELGSEIQDCERWGLVGEEQVVGLLEQYAETARLLERLLVGLRKKQKAGDWERGMPVREADSDYIAEE